MSKLLTSPKDEMMKLVKSMYTFLKTKNPNLDPDEFVAKSAFNECDSDGDGKITKEEFIREAFRNNWFNLEMQDIMQKIFSVNHDICRVRRSKIGTKSVLW